MKPNLGDCVKDRVSGFSGILVAQHLYLNGCTRCTLQPPIGDDGKLPASETFDEPQLVVTQSGVVQPDLHITGGPEKFSDVRRY